MQIVPKNPLSIFPFAANPKLVWALLSAAIGYHVIKHPPKLYSLQEVWYGTNGSSSSGGSHWQNPNYCEGGFERKLLAIKISYEGAENYELNIYNDWRFFLYRVHKRGELKEWSLAHGEEHYTATNYNPVPTPCPHKITELLLNYNLFKIENIVDNGK